MISTALRKRVSRAFIAVVLLGVLILSRQATATGGTGLVIETPMLFAAAISGEQENHFIVAHHVDGGSGTRIVAVRHTEPIGVAPMDDLTVDGSALSITQIDGLWVLTLSANLPTIGAIDLRLETEYGPDSSGIACTPWYYFVSPSRGLSEWGNVDGTIDGDPALSAACKVWGSNASGYYAILPLGEQLE